VQDVLDGTSLTVALSEVIQPNKPGQLVRDLRGLWISDLTSVYTHLRSPNSILPDRMLSGYCNPAKAPCQGNSPCWGTLITTARSYHPGGVNVGMADGGVRFISNTVDLLTVWQPLASIDSGEVIDGDTY
jgi:prepilin-type processing-associated H-X9-DG protein